MLRTKPTLYNLVEKGEWSEVRARLDIADEAELFYIKKARDRDRTVLQLAAEMSAPPEVIAGLVLKACESNDDTDSNVEFEGGRYVNQKNTKDSWTPLHFAIHHRASTATIKALFENGAAVDEIDKYGRTPLHLVTEDTDVQRINVVKLLLRHGSRAVGVSDGKGKTPLHHALEWDKEPSIVPLLLNHAVDGDRNNPLLLPLAVAGKQFTVAERLVREGASVMSIGGPDGRTALHWAAAGMCSGDLVKRFLEKGADKDALDKKGESPIAIATRIGNNSFLKTLDEFEQEHASKKKIKELSQSLETAKVELQQQQLTAAEAELRRLSAEKRKAKKRVAQAEETLKVRLEILEECYNRIVSKANEIAQLEASANDDIPEALVCHICAVNKRDRVLDCGHTFCSACVKKIRRKCSYCQKTSSKSKPIFLG